MLVTLNRSLVVVIRGITCDPIDVSHPRQLASSHRRHVRVAVALIVGAKPRRDVSHMRVRAFVRYYLG